MKKIYILSLALVSILAIGLGSCTTSRAYYGQPVPYRSSVSLIISARPGLIMERYPDGRYFYRSPEGYTYWRGYDNRFYLDRTYINRVHYNHGQYNDWNHYNRGYYHRRHR